MKSRVAAAIVFGLAVLGIVSASAAPRPVMVTANRSSLSASGGSVTIRATVNIKNAKTCTWTAGPEVPGFNRSVTCAAKLDRVAKLPANTTASAKRFTFSLDAVSGTIKSSGSAVVSEAPSPEAVVRALAIAAHKQIASEFPGEAHLPVRVSCDRHATQPIGSLIACAVYIIVDGNPVISGATFTSAALPVGTTTYTYYPR